MVAYGCPRGPTALSGLAPRSARCAFDLSAGGFPRSRSVGGKIGSPAGIARVDEVT
jgi:hypothetical protein